MIAGVATVVTATGCGRASTRSASTGSNAEIEALYRARVDSARARFTDADVRFITGMIAHHAQAIVMSRLAPTHGASPAVLTLTGRIINAQHDEIALMQKWLRDRRLPVPEVTPAGTDPHAGHGAHMPGMLTPEQLRQLDQARGLEFDRLFLTFMIQHHRGAVTMVDELFKAGGAGQDEAVFKIASDVQVDQITEINRMLQMLAVLPQGRP